MIVCMMIFTSYVNSVSGILWKLNLKKIWNECVKQVKTIVLDSVHRCYSFLSLGCNMLHISIVKEISCFFEQISRYYIMQHSKARHIHCRAKTMIGNSSASQICTSCLKLLHLFLVGPMSVWLCILVTHFTWTDMNLQRICLISGNHPKGKKV